jgi:hypothetical protein
MVLDLPLAAIFGEIGHDGGEIVYPELADPMCRRGFHPQELIDVCLTHRRAATLVELMPVLANTPGSAGRQVLSDNFAWQRFMRTIELTRGVIEGVTTRCGHAVAYEYGHIFDPAGREYDYSRDDCERRGFFTQHLWRIDEI